MLEQQTLHGLAEDGDAGRQLLRLRLQAGVHGGREVVAPSANKINNKNNYFKNYSMHFNMNMKQNLPKGASFELAEQRADISTLGLMRDLGQMFASVLKRKTCSILN